MVNAVPNVLIEDQGNVAILRLNNGVTNAISPLLVNDLSEALKNIRSKYRAVVLAGGVKFFSIGLDLPSLLKLDRTGMSDFWYKFNEVSLELYTLPLPTACTIAGHAVAGGNVLALTCDYRVAASGKTKIGLNEVILGIPVPYLANLILRQIVGDRAATEMLYHGEFLPVSDAKRIGLIDVVSSQGKEEEQAVGIIAPLAALSQPAFAAIKATRVEPVQRAYKENNKSNNETFLDCWFSEPVQVLLEKASEKF